MKEGKGEKAEEGKKFMLWGLIGIFVIFSVYGIIFFFQQTLGVGGFVNLNKPCTDFVNDCKSGTGSGLSPTKPSVIGEGVECKADNIGASCLNGAGTCGQNAYGYVCLTTSTGLGKCGNGEASECGSAGDCPQGYVCDAKYACAGSPNVCTPPSGNPTPNPTADTSCKGKKFADTCTMPSGFAGTCQLDGVSLVCRAQDVRVPDPLPPNQQGICFGKAEWTTCESDGICLSLSNTGLKLTDSQLVCRHGLIPLNKNDYCQPESYTRLCNKGLSCDLSYTDAKKIDYYQCK